MQVSDRHLSDRFAKRLKQRRRADARLRLYGMMAIGTALFLLVVLLGSIVFEARTAFTRHELQLSVSRDDRTDRSLTQDAHAKLLSMFGDPQDRRTRQDITQLVSALSLKIAGTTLVPGEVRTDQIVLSDKSDLYFKGLTTRVDRSTPVINSVSGNVLSGEFSDLYRKAIRWRQAEIDQLARSGLRSAEQRAEVLKRQLDEAPDDPDLQARLDGERTRAAQMRARIEGFRSELDSGSISLDASTASVLVRTPTGFQRVVSISENRMTTETLLENMSLPEKAQALFIHTPAVQRTLSDAQIAALEWLKHEGLIRNTFNTSFFARADSSEAELAGLLAATIGSILIILTTMLLAVPVGIAAAVYLEEFAPRNAFTRFIQVNINNLAAVPSIVFGLLGAAIFVNGVVIPIPFVEATFRLGGGLGRGWPIVGGIVLALMTLPTIIISSRAALSSVPDSIRQGALAVGATRLQTVHHHVMPMAAPGILTGSIIGLAQALGETAPLLLIGMVAFIGDLPSGVTDRSTALPVLIFQWSTRAERAWEPMTSAAIIILLALMLILNGLAVWLRMRYEKR
ncbi:MAG: phosphate ABC transporter, permease protein PstA [Ponticaulis sp.]|nr:phosphate ABC transporter, permease protein PstA [Ponticaulis sp.]